MASVCAKEKIAPRDQRGRKEAIFHANYYITAQTLVGYLSRFPYLGTLLPEGLTFWPHLRCAVPVQRMREGDHSVRDQRIGVCMR